MKFQISSPDPDIERQHRNSILGLLESSRQRQADAAILHNPPPVPYAE